MSSRSLSLVQRNPALLAHANRSDHRRALGLVRPGSEPRDVQSAAASRASSPAPEAFGRPTLLAVNSMHDSFMPLSGGILLANMMVDEVMVRAAAWQCVMVARRSPHRIASRLNCEREHTQGRALGALR
jgi:hypothetical protein